MGNEPMVQIIENWSLLRGQVVRLAPAAEYPGVTAVEFDVETVSSVEGFANLLQDRAGMRLTVFLSTGETSPLSPGDILTLRARLAVKNRVFAIVVSRLTC